MSKPSIYTREQLVGLLAALCQTDVNERTLRIVAAALCIEWAEVQVRAGKMIEEGE